MEQCRLGGGRGEVFGTGGAGVGGGGGEAGEGGEGGGGGIDRKFPQTRAAHRKKGFIVLEKRIFEKSTLGQTIVVTNIFNCQRKLCMTT